MDEHGLPIVGAGVDYSKVSNEKCRVFIICSAIRKARDWKLFPVPAGPCSRPQEHAGIPEQVRHKHSTVSQQVLHSL